MNRKIKIYQAENSTSLKWVFYLTLIFTELGFLSDTPRSFAHGEIFSAYLNIAHIGFALFLLPFVFMRKINIYNGSLLIIYTELMVVILNTLYFIIIGELTLGLISVASVLGVLYIGLISLLTAPIHTIIYGVTISTFIFIISLFYHFEASFVFPPVYALILYSFTLGMYIFTNKMINAFYNNHLHTEKLKEYARQLEVDQEKIRELGQFRQALINMVVHDMKTPLSHIISTLEGFAGSAAERLKKSGKQLLILVENILDVNKMENQKLCLEKSVVNLRSVSLRATEQVEHLYQKKSVRLENHLFDNLMVYANAVFLERIFINLLTNSIKYTPPRGKVSIFCNPLAKDQVSVKIHDTGKGIPKEKIPYVFNYYYQSDQKKLEKIVPTGIGLTFCKLAVEEHNGEIGVESDGKNGTTFWFTLPLSYSSKCIRENKARVIQSSVIKPDQLSIPQEQIEQLRKTPVYKASSILETLDQIPDENADVTEWKTQVKRAVFSTDVEFYNKLTDRNGR